MVTTQEIIARVNFSPVAAEDVSDILLQNWESRLTPDDRFVLERVFWDLLDAVIDRASRKYRPLGHSARDRWQIAEIEVTAGQYLPVAHEDLAAVYRKVRPILRAGGLLNTHTREQPPVVSEQVAQALSAQFDNPRPADVSGKRRSWIAKKRPSGT